MRLRIALAVLCLLGAVVAAVLARDAWRTDDAIRDGDARASVGAVTSGAWDADTVFPGDPARSWLGLGDDLEFRELMLHGQAVADRGPATDRDAERTAVKNELGENERTDANRVRAARAANLLGVLLFTDPDDPEVSPAERAVGSFQDAVLLDPGNAAAKANLELILRQLTTSSPKGRSSPGGGDQGGKGGAGLAPAGRGY
jgi:hypothetical protein